MKTKNKVPFMGRVFELIEKNCVAPPSHPKKVREKERKVNKNYFLVSIITFERVTRTFCSYALFAIARTVESPLSVVIFAKAA